MDTAGPFGAHSGNQQGDTGTDIRRHHIGSTQFEAVSQTDHSCPVRITKDNLRSHIDQFVDKKETALKHLLMDQHAADRLCRYNKEDTQQVRRQSRPGRIGNCHDRTVDKCLDLIRIVCRDMDIVSHLFDSDPEAAE